MEIFAKNNIGIWKFASKTIFEYFSNCLGRLAFPSSLHVGLLSLFDVDGDANQYQQRKYDRTRFIHMHSLYYS